MEDGIVKAENEIVLPEGVADNVVNIVVAREPQKKSFIETGMYASYLLIQMGSMLVNALNGDVFDARLSDSCSSENREYKKCESTISVDKKGNITFRIYHSIFEPRCSKNYRFSYDISLLPRKSRIALSLQQGYELYKPELFFRKLEQMAAQYNTEDAEKAIPLYNDFCTLPERLSSVLVPIKENHERVQKAAEEHLKSLQDLERRLLR